MADEKKKEKKEKKAKEPAGVVVSIAQHPRAKAGIRRARTRAAFGAFVIVFALNLIKSADLFDAVWRALLAGIVVNIIVWRCALVVWKHVLLAELRAEEERRIERAPRAPGADGEARRRAGRSRLPRRVEVMEPIYRVQRREPGAEPVQRVAPPRLLTPAEREQAKKDREKKRKQAAKKSRLKSATEVPTTRPEATWSCLVSRPSTRS